jgi:hypothetical protein
MAASPRSAVAATAVFAFAAIAVTPARAASGLKYNIAFYTDNKCGTKGVSGDAWVPDTCYPMVTYAPITTAAASACASSKPSDLCTPGMLVSFGAKLVEDTPGKQVTISGFLSTTAGNYGACQAANLALTASNAGCAACSACDSSTGCVSSYYPPRVCCPSSCSSCGSAPSYNCNTAQTAGETCNDAVPSCKGPGCSYGGASKLILVNGLATDTCAALSDSTCQTTGICSVMIKTGLGAGAIVGIIIAVIAIGAMAAAGYCYRSKSGPFAHGATWLGYLRSGCGCLGAAQPAAAKATEPVVATQNSAAVLVIRATGAADAAAAGAPVGAAAAAV